jgi:hypothetical protein
MTTPGTGSFTVKSWDEQPYSESEGESKLTRASVTNSFHGDVQGESILEYLLIYVDGSSGSFIGLEKVVGQVGGRSGSFVLQHSGTFEGKTVQGSWSVVPGSGSGELKGLRGTGGFVAEHGKQATPYTLDYELA